MSRIIHAGLTDKGRVRRHNEDRWLANPGMGLYIVADGMGGAEGGAMAAQMVIEALPHLMRKQLRGINSLTGHRAKQAVQLAVSGLNEEVRSEGKRDPRLGNMGATVVFALIQERHALITHLGDSRAYLFRNGEVDQLTRDHSSVQRMLESGQLSREEALKHPSYGRLSHYVGMPGEAWPDVVLLEVMPGDQFLLCSDGLTEMLSVEDLRAIGNQRLSPSEACQRLIHQANEAGGNDNITAVWFTVIPEKEPVTG